MDKKTNKNTKSVKIEKSNKTDYVLRLLTNSFEEQTKSNPILDDDFKDVVIHSRSKNDEKDDKTVNIEKAQPQETSEAVNIISLIVEKHLGEVIGRFKCCGCKSCRDEMTVRTLNAIEPYYISGKMLNDNQSNQLIEDKKAIVMVEMVRNAIQFKKNPLH